MMERDSDGIVEPRKDPSVPSTTDTSHGERALTATCGRQSFQSCWIYKQGAVTRFAVTDPGPGAHTL